MSRLERTLIGIALALLLGIGGAVQYWRINRPVFLRAAITEQDSILRGFESGQFSKHVISHRLVQGLYYECWMDHYEHGELVESRPIGTGRFDGEGERGKAILLSGVTTGWGENLEQKLMLCFGIDGWLHGTPATSHEQMRDQLFSPEAIRLVLDEPVTIGVLVLGSEYLASDQVFDKQNMLKDQALQQEHAYVLRMKLSRTGD